MKEYHFSLGNSSKGAIGFCASVRAESRAEAVDILSAALPSEISVPCGGGGVEYVQVYFNVDKITARAVDEVTDVDDREHCTNCNEELEKSQIGLCDDCQTLGVS